MILIKRNEQVRFIELSNTCVFASSDPVEAFAYDAGSGRMVVTSQFGKIKLYQLEKNGE